MHVIIKDIMKNIGISFFAKYSLLSAVLVNFFICIVCEHNKNYDLVLTLFFFCLVPMAMRYDSTFMLCLCVTNTLRKLSLKF